MTEFAMGRRDLLKAGGVCALGAGALSTAGRAAAADSSAQPAEAPDPSEYGEILAEMDGDGSAEAPYVVTDVVELQAMNGDRGAHFELGGDVDASATAEWNEISRSDFEVIGRGNRTSMVLSFPPEPDSVELFVGEEGDRSRISPSEYEIDHETGEITFDEEPGGDSDQIRAAYDLAEPVGKGFDPIGMPDDPFAGRFDGNGHRIRGLTIGRGDESGVGLFGTVKPGDVDGPAIANVGLDGVEVSGANGVGCLVGWSHPVGDGVIVSNAYAEGRARNRPRAGVTGALGGLVGSKRGGAITHCYAAVRVEGAQVESGHVGGLIGNNYEGRVEQCYATGAVTGQDKTGGLAGRTDGTIAACYATGDVTGEWNTGGLAGYVWDGTVRECRATGAVVGYDHVGGLVGGLTGTGLVESSHARGSVENSDNPFGAYVASLVGEISENGTVRSCYATCEVTADGDEDPGGLVARFGNLAQESSMNPVVRDAYWDAETTGCDAGIPDREPGDGELTVEGIEGLATSAMTGETAATEMPGLDFSETWEPVTDEPGYPRLRRTVAAGIVPTASISIDPAEPDTATELTLDAGETVPAGDIASYEWDLTGDGEVDATGERVTHTFSEAGTHEVSVTVTAENRRTDSVTRTVQVAPAPTETPTETPTATETDAGAGGPATGTEAPTASGTDTTGGADEASTTTGSGPGFGVAGAIASLGGLAHVLRRRLE